MQKVRIRHGDVLLTKIGSLPKGAKKLTDKVLAYGEVTGHSHRFENPDNINRFKLGNKLYLQVYQDTPITHEEHGSLIIKRGIYEQGKEKEFDPFMESIRIVVD